MYNQVSFFFNSTQISLQYKWEKLRSVTGMESSFTDEMVTQARANKFGIKDALDVIYLYSDRCQFPYRIPINCRLFSHCGHFVIKAKLW